MAVTASDEQLIERMAAGDEGALIELHRRYAPHLTAMARRMLHDPDEVGRSVEAAFVSAWHAAARFDPEKVSARTWLVILAHRLISPRARDRQTPFLLENWGAPPQATGMGAEPGAVTLSSAPVTAEARDLLERAFFGGHAPHELAEQTGKPLEAVRRELRAALEGLRSASAEPES